MERIERRAAARMEGRVEIGEKGKGRGESGEKGKGREVLREVQAEARERRAVLSSSSEDEERQIEEESDEVPVPPLTAETRGWREAGAQETVLGTAKVRSPGRNGEWMKPVEEEAGKLSFVHVCSG